MPLDITPVILAGGKGVRLRPLTGAERPKPFLKLFSEYSLLQETLLRSSNMAPPVVVTHQLYAARVEQEMKALGLSGRIVAEPEGKSTAPAIALAAFALRDENKPMLVMPSDHYIEDVDKFQGSVSMGMKALSSSDVVLLGAPAKKPETRYGYIRADHTGRVESFIEKPDAHHARLLLRSGLCYWNTGIFLTHPQRYLELLEQCEPRTYWSTHAAYDAAVYQGRIVRPDVRFYSENSAIAVDCAIMENITKTISGTKHVATVVPLTAPWQDVGSWSSLLGTKLKLIKKKVHDKRYTYTKR